MAGAHWGRRDVVLQVSLSSTVAHENMVQLLDVFAEGTELIIVVSAAVRPKTG